MLATWYLVVGLLLVGVALAGTTLARLPLSASMIYLAVGFGLGHAGVLRPVAADAAVLEVVAEIAVLVSLFTAGLKLRLPVGDPLWRVPLRLATLAMVLTVALVAAAGVLLFGLELGLAVLIAGVLAPTDPVMASDVQVSAPRDQDRLRFGLTGEAGLNDGTAFPFVLLGLGLLGHHPLGGGLRWLLVDVLWAVAAAVAIGALAGTQVGRLVLYLRRRHREAVGLDNFLALGLTASAYGLSLLVHAYGFLAVFAAGVALRRVESASGDEPATASMEGDLLAADPPPAAIDPVAAPRYMARAVLLWNEQLERIAEVALVVVIGSLWPAIGLSWPVVGLVALLLFVARPLASLLGLVGSSLTGQQRGLVAWFGIRGVGTLYYAAYAVHHGLPADQAALVLAVCVVAVTTSVLLHGTSVTPLMNLYERNKQAPG